MSDKKLAKIEKLREKNEKRLLKGKKTSQGWGRMVDTGLGGLNKTGLIIDRVSFVKDQQKSIARDNDRKNS